VDGRELEEKQKKTKKQTNDHWVPPKRDIKKQRTIVAMRGARVEGEWGGGGGGERRRRKEEEERNRQVKEDATQRWE
jgi:hypothetical protein